MSGLEITDSFGPMLKKAVGNFGSSVERATGRNAALLQRNVEVGIRRQKYKSDWPSLKEETLKVKAKEKKSNLILIGEGDLSSSFEVIKHSLGIYEVGTMSPYARAHEFGYEAKGIPARPYFRPAMDDSFNQMKENWSNALKEIFK
ncbi:MAG: phage virion morphogenesis protein [Leptospiraceae bacterium]|nr:phage virion morphogenesis protein [Leptospiraceae bacterium]